MKLSIRALLETELISDSKISKECKVPLDIITLLKMQPNLIDKTPFPIIKRLYSYYLQNKNTLLPLHTYLYIRKKYELKHYDKDYIFLDFYETKKEAIGCLGSKYFYNLVSPSIGCNFSPFFILTYLNCTYIYNIREFELLICKLNEIKK